MAHIAQADIITILKNDHIKHRELLNKIESSFKNPMQCLQLLEEFSIDVKAHASAAASHGEPKARASSPW